MKRQKSQPTDAQHTIAFVLQGGGALGAYQAGACEALAIHARHPDWVAGISIGAINAALIAGNTPEQRIERLRTFWERITSPWSDVPWGLTSRQVPGPAAPWLHEWSAAWGALFGLPGFFSPRPGAAGWPGPMASPSFYDTGPLRETLLELVDFDRLNDGPTRISVGAVDVQSGNFAYFDNRHGRLEPQHIMASAALPPGFPAIEVQGRWYWDGGLVSNTPLSHVVDHLSGEDATIFQVDLFSARGDLPHTLAQVAEREKDIRYSSRTRLVTDVLRDRHELHRRIRELGAMLPAARRADPAVQQLLAGTDDTSVTLVHLIHRHKGGESQTKDYDFSRGTMLGHWQAGRADMTHSLHSLAAAPTDTEPSSFRVFDYHPRSTDADSR
jgi:NTE family protein